MPKRKLQMRFRIEHELKGRMRLHVCTKKMSYEEADTLQYYLGSFPFVTKVKVHENIGNVTVNYVGPRKRLCEALGRLSAGKGGCSGRVSSQFRTKVKRRV